MRFDTIQQTSNASFGKSNLEVLHWREAAILASFSGTEPIWDIVLPSESETMRLRKVARECLDKDIRSREMFERRLIERGCNQFRDFANHWMVTDFVGRRPTDEIITVLSFVTKRDQNIGEFWAEALSVPDVLSSLVQARNIDDDERILAAIDKFEVAIARGGNDSWEEKFMKGMSFDPFVELSYPIYRGYVDRSLHDCVKGLFSKTFGANSLRVLLDRYQTLFGPLDYPDAWESLLK
jgi:hypothetical protein